MGRIDAVLDDKLEQRFRLEAAKRYGLRKGNLGRAITEAIEAWTTTDEDLVRAKKLAKSIRDPKSSVEIKGHAVAALAALGTAGLNLLTDIGADSSVPDSVRTQALKELSRRA